MAITERYVTSSAAGGGVGTSGDPWTLSEAITNATAGDRVNVKAGTYTRSATDSPANAGTATSPVIWRGYNTVIGDLDDVTRTNNNGALVTTNFPVIAYNSGFRWNSTGTFNIYQNLVFTGTFAGALVQKGADSVMYNCKVTNSSTSGSAVAAASNSRTLAIECDFILNGASGGNAAYSLSTTGAIIAGCRVNGGPNIGISASNTGVILACTIFGHTGHGIACTATAGVIAIINNTIAAPNSSGTGDGINVVTGTTGRQTIMGNHITDQKAYGINLVSAANAAFLAYNRLRDNVSGGINSGTDWAAGTSLGHVTTDTGSVETDYMNAASGDFRLIATAAGVLGSFPYARDIGAAQSQSGGGGTLIGSRYII